MIDVEIINQTQEAIDLCRRDANHRWIMGTVKCPRCGKNIKYKISGYNGHCHGECETPQCLSWVE